MNVGLYIHVPFCKSKCAYCDFYSVKPDEELKTAYTGAVIASLQKFSGLTADTVYFGGGNPLALGAEGLCGLLDSIGNIFNIETGAEITSEANPEDLSPASASALRSGGFNRLSMGIQSLDDAQLAVLGRRHSARSALAAAEAAAAAGELKLSADLMIGLPMDGIERAVGDTVRLMESGLNHLSVYILKTEPGTLFYEKKDSLELPGDEKCADIYLAVCEAAQSGGLLRYEISNFAKKGEESRHNMKYWKMDPYIGIGPSAHSFYKGERYFYPRSLESFVKNPQKTEPDGKGGGAEEYIMTALRLREGMDVEILRDRYGIELNKNQTSFLETLEREKLITREKTKISLTARGCLVSNYIISRLI